MSRRAFKPCLLSVGLCVCFVVWAPQALGQCEVAELLPAQPLGVLHFGRDVSISGDLVVVGADLDYSPLPKAGSAYIFRREGRSWIEEANVTASDPAVQDRFGFQVAISGELAAVGSLSHDHMGDGSGAVYVFRREGTSWVEEAELLASDAAAGDGLGFSLDIDGEAIAVGASGNDDAGEWSGSAYVFRRNDNNTPADPSDDFWVEEAKLVASDAAAGDSFGHSISISGDLVIVGARDNDAAAAESGSAYVYRRDGATWLEEAKLVGSDLTLDDAFGYSVSLDGDAAVVGATSHHHPDIDTWIGAAYVFRRDDNGTPADPNDDFWFEEAELIASDASRNDSFGWDVSISGDRIVVGTPWTDDAAPAAGSAYFFEKVGSSWVELDEFIASDAAEDDHFAGAVSIDGDFFVAGAVGHDHGGGNAGSAYVFAVDGEDCNDNESPDICETDTDGDGVIDDCDPCPLDNPDDSDHDGVCDSDDLCPGFDDRLDDDDDSVPDDCDICPGFDDNADSDGDGQPDGCDGCPQDSNKLDPGVCGCGVPDEGDSDDDGVLDCVDQCPDLDDAAYAPQCVGAIPTVSNWGIAVLALLLLAAAKIRFSSRWMRPGHSDR